MAYQSNFKRYELKYILDPEQAKAIYAALEGHMKLDGYGHTVIRTIYYDTDDFLLCRRSNDKPFYKEKLRVRSYKKAGPEDTVYVELKKKYDGIVYKRRLGLPNKVASDWLCNGVDPGTDSQIKREIDYFLKFYGNIHPAMFMSYEREAYFEEGGDFRLTLDSHILYRTEEFDFSLDPHGRDVLPEGYVLMEVKSPLAIPLWLTSVMSEKGISRASFSKYGSCYKQMFFDYDVLG